MPGYVEQFVTQEKEKQREIQTAWKMSTEQFLEQLQRDGHEKMRLDLSDTFIAQVSYDHAKEDPEQLREIAAKVAQWGKEDLREMESTETPGESAFRKGQIEAIKEFEAKHGLRIQHSPAMEYLASLPVTNVPEGATPEQMQAIVHALAVQYNPEPAQEIGLAMEI